MIGSRLDEVLSRMESNKTAELVGLHWQEAIVFATRAREYRKSNWESAVFAAVFLLHATLIAYGYYWQKDLRNNALSVDEALQVSFIDRIIMPALKPSDSAGKQSRGIVSTQPRKSAALEIDAHVPAENAEIQDKQALRLTMDVDEWKPTAVITPRNPLKRQFIALPGRAEPFIHGIKLANTPTPEQRLQLLGKLFGAVEYDPCKEARNRMASGQSQVSAFDLEHDLRNIELHCRP